MDSKHRKVRTFISNLTAPSHQTQLQALQQLRLMTKQDEQTRPLIADDPNAIPSLIQSLYSPSHPLQEHASATLLNISISLKDPLVSALPAISHLLSRHSSTSSPSAVQSSAATLHSLLVLDHLRPIVGSKRDILSSLIDIINNADSPIRSVKDSLKALFGISLHPLNRCAMIELGAVEALFRWVLRDGDVKVGVLEDVTAVIAQIAGCEESVEAFEKVSGIGVLVDVLEKKRWSMKMKENAVSGLLKLVRCGGERVVVDVRVRALGAFDGIEDVKENGSSKGKAKAEALLVELMGDASHWNNSSTHRGHSRFYSSSSSSHGSWFSFNFSTDSSESGV